MSEQRNFAEKVAPNAQYYGPGGFMSTPALENPVISTHIRPMGLDEYLPAYPATVVNPLYPVFTGVTDETGAEPATVCDDGPTALLKGATMTANFGRIMRSTPVMDKGQLSETVRGQTTDLSLLAAQGAPGGRLNVGNLSVPTDDILRYATRGAFFVVGTILQRKLSRMLWAGNPATNNPATDGYREFPGLDLQIGTGRVDALSGVAVPSLDSYVVNANYANVNDYGIVAALEDMEARLRNRAMNHFGTAEFALVMLPEMWDQLTRIWPIQYNTTPGMYVMPGMSNVSVSVNADAMVAARDEMRRTRRITINGYDYPVILDHGIAEETTADVGSLDPGTYASTIYFIPLTVAGGFPATRIEYLDFRVGIAEEQRAGLNTGLVWTDDGKYIWSAKEEHTCFWFRARIEPRVVLHTPHLAGKIQRLVVAPPSHYESPYPDSAYHVNGGLSVRPMETFYTPWSA
jgi:hypothetical protein